MPETHESDDASRYTITDDPGMLLLPLFIHSRVVAQFSRNLCCSKSFFKVLEHVNRGLQYDGIEECSLSTKALKRVSGVRAASLPLKNQLRGRE
jgi:hypothetical protein